jgi:hypothetical protein
MATPPYSACPIPEGGMVIVCERANRGEETNTMKTRNAQKRERMTMLLSVNGTRVGIDRRMLFTLVDRNGEIILRKKTKKY